LRHARFFNVPIKRQFLVESIQICRVVHATL
jgi:hypothetical protein